MQFPKPWETSPWPEAFEKFELPGFRRPDVVPDNGNLTTASSEVTSWYSDTEDDSVESRENEKEDGKQNPKEVKINIACDQLASETTNVVKSQGVPSDLPKLLNPPYKGSRAMLRIGKMWITSNTKHTCTRQEELHWCGNT